MKYLKEWNNWTSTSSTGVPVELDYKSSDKITYNNHKVILTNGDKSIEVLAKFDTGAKSSSIDFGVAEKLGFSEAMLNRCKELQTIKIPQTISDLEKTKMELQISTFLKKEFPEISKVKVVKSSSGTSVRAFIRLKLTYNGRTITTNVNLRDRAGLKCEMLVGLDDML